MEVGKKAIDRTIQRLVVQHAVADQATLLEFLAQEGFRLTQGTLSRRLARLSIRKRDGRYQRVTSSPLPVPPYSVSVSLPNLLVLTTHPGLGQALAQRVDRTALSGVAGTVAGEDSLFIAVQAGVNLQDVQSQVERLLGPPQAAR